MAKDTTHRPYVTRREFLIGTAGLAGMSLLARKAWAAPGEPLPSLSGYSPSVTCYWAPKKEHDKTFFLFKKMVDAATDFSWLSRGDRVLLKLAMNSGVAYPRTTDPWLLDSMIQVLKAKGAKIVVGDSAGCGHVRWTPSEKKGSSRKLCEDLGLLKVINQNDQSQFKFFQ